MDIDGIIWYFYIGILQHIEVLSSMEKHRRLEQIYYDLKNQDQR